MKQQSDADSTLRQLEFELDQGSGPRFLLAICDSDERAKQLRNQLTEHLQEVGIEGVGVLAPPNTGNLVDAILQQAASRKPGVVQLVQLADTVPVGTDKLFGELNFQRDSLAKLGIPIIIWLYSNQLSQLASRAPDFWSRRTAIFYFDTVSVSALLTRIFSDAAKTTDPTSDEISQALREVVSSEDELRHCLSNRRNFSLSRADSVIQRLRAGIHRLLSECSKGRRIDVTLWLWNSSLNLRLIGGGAGDASAYLDRNELLLPLAERIESLLNRYLQELDRRIQEKAPINLVGLFSAYGTNIWKNMVRHAAQDAMRNLSIEPYDFVETRSTSNTWLEDVFRNRATEEFESWLAGDIKEQPPIFSDEEASVLKYLYRNKDSRSLSPPLPARRIKELIPLLQTKVRLWLGDIGKAH